MDLDKNVYEYFEYCRDIGNVKGAIVVTDKQSVIGMATSEDDFSTHNEMANNIERMIHPEEQYDNANSYRSNNSYTYLSSKDIVMTLPEDGSLSPNQAVFLTDIINQVCDFNEINNDCVSIEIFYKEEARGWRGHDKETINKFILSKLTEKYKTDVELIIGDIIYDGKVIDPRREINGKSI